MLAADLIDELFSSVGPVTVRKMFGGQGIYAEGKIIAVVLSTGDLFVKGDPISIARYTALGMTQWTHTNQKTGKTGKMPYWKVADSAFDDPDEMQTLAQLALETARRVVK